MVPKDAPELKFDYLEIYEDDFNGNTYQVNLGNSLEYKEDPDAPKPVGNYQTAVGDVSETSFFDMTVTDTYRTDSVKGYTCDEGFEFLAVTVDIVNTMDDVIPVGVSDFTVSWGSAGDDEWDYAVEDENVVSFPIEQSLAAGQEVYGDVYFVVPKNAENFTFNYVEYFADGTTGSSYTIPLDIPEFRANFA